MNSTKLDIMQWPYPVPAEDVAASFVIQAEPFGKCSTAAARARSRDYQSALKAQFAAAVGSVTPDPNVCYALRCIFVRASRQRIDCDNMLKAVSDAATGIVWADDSQVHEVIGRMKVVRGNPSAHVVIHRVAADTLDTECSRCGKSYKAYPSIPRKFCSKACQHAASSVLLNCPECKKDFRIAESKLRSAKKKGYHTTLCSRPCSMKAHSRRLSATKRSHLWKCVDCKSPVSRPEYQRCRACFIATKPVTTSNYWTRTPEFETA